MGFFWGRVEPPSKGGGAGETGGGVGVGGVGGRGGGGRRGGGGLGGGGWGGGVGGWEAVGRENGWEGLQLPLVLANRPLAVSQGGHHLRQKKGVRKRALGVGGGFGGGCLF